MCFRRVEAEDNSESMCTWLRVPCEFFKAVLHIYIVDHALQVCSQLSFDSYFVSCTGWLEQLVSCFICRVAA
jgi:hypothetical protein